MGLLLGNLELTYECTRVRVPCLGVVRLDFLPFE